MLGEILVAPLEVIIIARLHNLRIHQINEELMNNQRPSGELTFGQNTRHPPGRASISIHCTASEKLLSRFIDGFDHRETEAFRADRRASCNVHRNGTQCDRTDSQTTD